MTITAKRPRAARETNSTPVARLTIDSPVLLRAVKAVSLVVARSNTIPILSNVAIKADPAGTVRLWATDQDIAILRTTPADVPAAFGTTVGAKTLAAVLDAISPRSEERR